MSSRMRVILLVAIGLLGQVLALKSVAQLIFPLDVSGAQEKGESPFAQEIRRYKKDFRRVLGHLTGVQICGDEWPVPRHTDPEIYQDAAELIRSKGYPVELHSVTTADGYILTLVRIPHGVNNTNSSRRAKRPVVLLMHGLLDSCVTWINNPANESAGFVMADAGFDVWLGNSRGNTYAKRHTHLTPKDKAFWQFSWDMMAAYDLPATIDDVIRLSGQDQIFYMGHSQGTEIGFAAFSRNQTLANKVRAFYALGPVSTLGHVISPVKYLAPFAQSLAVVIDLFGDGEFLPSDALMKFLARWACSDQLSPICSNIVFLFSGYDCKYTNMTRLPVYTAHTPAGTSAMNMVHYAQSILSNRFQMYDYGKEENMAVYHQETPPLYNVSDMLVPTSLIWGGKDWLADPQDVKLLIPRIRNLLYSQFVPNYNHLDFVWGYNARIKVYERIIKSMKSLVPPL